MNTLRAALACASAALLLGGYAQAASNAYPSKPIRLIIPFPIGGPTDIAARAVIDAMSRQLGQAVIADNRPGASGNIAAALAAHAAPDGYTLFWAQGATHGINPSLYQNLGYDPVKDFAPVGLVSDSTIVLLAHPSLKLRNARELIALAKSKPGALHFASGGTGTPPHMAGELFAKAAGVRWNHVPYKGSASALPDVLAGRVPIMFDGVASALPHVRSGRLKALAVTAATRHRLLPNVPALAEILPGYEVSGWGGVLAPAGTPHAVIARLAQALAQSTQDAAVKARFETLGMTIRTAPPEKTAQHIRNEIDKWRAVVETTGTRIE